MGFPDTFRLFSLDDREEDLFKQVGNAVPVTLAKAIGTSPPSTTFAFLPDLFCVEILTVFTKRNGIAGGSLQCMGRTEGSQGKREGG
jgi:hypothetical protein